MWLVIEVEFEDLDQDLNTDLYGPYQSQERADEICDAIKRRFDRIPDSTRGERFIRVSVRPLRHPNVRKIAREARTFIEEGEG